MLSQDQRKKYRDAIFVVCEEELCPVYNVGEEFKVEDNGLTVPEAKPVCLILAMEISKITATHQSLERFTGQGVKKARFECGGCSGIIRFEYKKEKEFATLQMKLLAAAEKRAKRRHLDSFYNVLRGMAVFEPLKDEDISDLTELLELREYAPNKIILKKGSPGNALFIMLAGTVSIIGQDGSPLSRLEEGDIFGEMSLLSGEPVTTSVVTHTPTRVATLSSKDFKHILNKYPVLQVFFYRLLVERAQVNSVRDGTISSGMGGELAEINTIELFQLINSSQKTGRIDLVLADGEASILFHEGELVSATYGDLEGKEAFFTLLARSEGHFTYTSGLTEEEKALDVLGGFMGLVMEGMRRIDEGEGPTAL